MIAYSHYSYGCSVKHNSGPTACSGITIPRNRVETILLNQVRTALGSPEATQQLLSRVETLMKEHASNGNTEAEQITQRVAELEKEIGRVVDAIAAVGISTALKERLKSAETEKLAWWRRVENMQSPPKHYPQLRSWIATKHSWQA